MKCDLAERLCQTCLRATLVVYDAKLLSYTNNLKKEKRKRNTPRRDRGIGTEAIRGRRIDRTACEIQAAR